MKQREIRQIAVIDTGTIGASWAAYFLPRGLRASDPAPEQTRDCAISTCRGPFTGCVAARGSAPCCDRACERQGHRRCNQRGAGAALGAYGLHLTFHLAGGSAGLAHFLDQFGPPLESGWDQLGAPSLIPEIRRALTAGVAKKAEGRDIPRSRPAFYSICLR